MIKINYNAAKKSIEKIIIEKNENKIIKEIVDFLYNNFSKYSWIGIYIVKGPNLILGPWRGKKATEHIKIPIGVGICGSAADSGKTEIINNVNEDNRYLACFKSTQSEIVIPIIKNNEVIGEIDIDSDQPNAFNIEDKKFLETIADMIKEHICI